MKGFFYCLNCILLISVSYLSAARPSDENRSYEGDLTISDNYAPFRQNENGAKIINPGKINQ